MMEQIADLPKVYGPFNGRNRRGLPIVMKNGFPAWAWRITRERHPELYQKEKGRG